MKKLTAAVCAVVIALSMAGCGSGDSGSTSKDKDSNSDRSAVEKIIGTETNEDLETANSKTKTVYNELAETVADAEMNGISLSKLLDGKGEGDYKLSADKTYNAAESIDDSAAQEIANRLENKGCFIIIKCQIGGNDTYAVQWKADENSTVFGQYPYPIEWEDHTSGEPEWGKFYISGGNNDINTDYKFITDDTVYLQTEEVSELAETSKKQARAICRKDFDTFKSTIDLSVIGEEDMTDSELKETFDSFCEYAESSGLTEEKLEQRVTEIKIYDGYEDEFYMDIWFGTDTVLTQQCQKTESVSFVMMDSITIK